LGVLVFDWLLVRAAWFDRPGENTMPAAANVFVARRVQEGGPLYDDWRVRPHVVAYYGPLLYLPVGLIGRWTGADVHGLFMIGRWISLLATLGTAGLIVAVLRVGRAVPPVIALGSAMVFLAAYDVFWRHDISFRPDAPTWFLTMLGLYLVVRRDRGGALYGSVLVFLLAFLYKQSCVAGPVAVGLWLILTGRRREAIGYGALAVGSFVGVTILLNAATDGRYLLNTVYALKGNTDFGNVVSLIPGFAGAVVVPLVVSAYALVVESSPRRWDVVAVLFVVSLVVSAAGTWRSGSGHYYYALALPPACVVCGRQLARWWPPRRVERPVETVLMVALSLAAVRYVPEAGLRLTEIPVRWKEFSQRHQSHRLLADFFTRLTGYLNSLPGPVLSQYDEMGLYCPRSIMIDTFTFSSMADAGVFDDGSLIEEIRQGKIEAIVISPQTRTVYQSTYTFSRRWREAMGERYRRVDVPGLEWAEIYRPVDRAAAPSAHGAAGIPPRP